MNELQEEYSELKKKIFDQHGTPGKEEGTVRNQSENREVFASEYNDLISIEHDLETEKLSFPNKIEDGISASRFEHHWRLFFDLSGLGPEEIHRGIQSIN